MLEKTNGSYENSKIILVIYDFCGQQKRRHGLKILILLNYVLFILFFVILHIISTFEPQNFH